MSTVSFKNKVTQTLYSLYLHMEAHFLVFFICPARVLRHLQQKQLTHLGIRSLGLCHYSTGMAMCHKRENLKFAANTV